MKKLLLLLAITTFLAACAGSSTPDNHIDACDNCAADYCSGCVSFDPTQTPAPETTPENTQPPEYPQPNANTLVWLVEPTLEYDNVHWCSALLEFFIPGSPGDVRLDPITGLPQEDQFWGGCGARGGPWLSYDSERGLMGFLGGYEYLEVNVEFFPLAEFPVHFYTWVNNRIIEQRGHEWFDEEQFHRNMTLENRIHFVQRIDSSLREQQEGWTSPDGIYYPGLEIVPWGAIPRPAQVALFYNGSFISDFVFGWQSGFDWGQGTIGNLAVVRHADTELWGFIDSQGNEALPFIFENIAHNGETVFARIDGHYGILDLPATLANFAS